MTPKEILDANNELSTLYGDIDCIIIAPIVDRIVELELLLERNSNQ